MYKHNEKDILYWRNKYRIEKLRSILYKLEQISNTPKISDIKKDLKELYQDEGSKL